MQTYHTLQDMRIVFIDGTVLDTSDPASRAAFLKVRYNPASSAPLLPWLYFPFDRYSGDINQEVQH